MFALIAFILCTFAVEIHLDERLKQEKPEVHTEFVKWLSNGHPYFRDGDTDAQINVLGFFNTPNPNLPGRTSIFFNYSGASQGKYGGIMYFINNTRGAGYRPYDYVGGQFVQSFFEKAPIKFYHENQSYFLIYISGNFLEFADNEGNFQTILILGNKPYFRNSKQNLVPCPFKFLTLKEMKPLSKNEKYDITEWSKAHKLRSYRTLKNVLSSEIKAPSESDKLIKKASTQSEKN